MNSGNLCGVGGIRTLVQTGSETVFYMLSSGYLVGERLVRNRPICTVFPETSPEHRESDQAIPAFLMPHPEHRQEGFPGRQPVLNF